MMTGDTGPVQGKVNDAEKQKAVTKQADCLLEECEDFCGVALGKRLVGNTEAEARALAARISKMLTLLSDRDWNADQDRRIDLRKYRIAINRLLIESNEAEASNASSPRESPGKSRPNTGLLSQLSKNQVEFELSRLADARMPDVASGVEVDPEDLKDLLKVTVPDIKRCTDRLRESIKSYASQPEAEASFVMHAQARCEYALEWISSAEDRGRLEQVHLDSKQPSREVDFQPWQPNNGVSIYEFLKKFENWSRGNFSPRAQASSLYSKHLDRSVVDGCKELEERKGCYASMREWLVQRWGRATLVGDLYLSNITDLKVPQKSDGPSVLASYLKGMYSNLVTVSTLEVVKGRPVPGLKEYITSNRWLKDISLEVSRNGSCTAWRITERSWTTLKAASIWRSSSTW